MSDTDRSLLREGVFSAFQQENVVQSIVELLDRSASAGLIITEAIPHLDSLLYINTALSNLLGYTPEEILALYRHNFTGSIHPDDLSCFRRTINDVLQSGKDGNYLIRFRKKDGGYRCFSGCLRLYRDQPAIHLVIGFYTDINELVEAKTRLEAQNAIIAEQSSRLTLDVRRFKSAVLLSGMSFFEFDRASGRNTFFDGEDEDFNKHRITFSFTKTDLDFSTPERRNHAIRKMVQSDDAARLIAAVESIYAEKAVSCEARVLADDGQYYWCRIKMLLITNESGAPSRILGTIVNINDAKFKAEMMEMKAGRAQNSLRVSQIGTHFFYHILSTIRTLTRTNPQMAGDMLYDVSKYLRYKTDGALIAGSIIPFSQELKSIRSFVNLKKVILREKLNVCYELCEKDFCIPVLTVQPLVENAIEHGIEKKAEGGTVWIRTSEEADCFQIVVEDDGVGYDHTIHIDNKPASIGRKNIEDRLAFYGADNYVSVDSVPGKGTTVCLRVSKTLSDEALDF